MHGVPASAYLYRKVVPELAAKGLRGIAIDLPGLGFAERPADADYTWTGLGRWLLSAINALRLDRFHLLLHDIGGPIGFEVASAVPERVLSITLLNTIVEVQSFHRPWPMEPFAHRGVGEAWLASMHVPGTFAALMRLVGVSRRVPIAELACWLPLLFGDDGGRAFLKIMRGFELTAVKQHLYVDAVRNTRLSRADRVGRERHHASVATLWRPSTARCRSGRAHDVAGQALLQEDYPSEIAAAVHRIVARGGQSFRNASV